ncbi:uncharacterized protein ACA1_010620 [Acanthamoeba castellanii str. Neff]|uniref:Uncharacterized protein n=1 Tax=Acanthamoeba castellanii (strain ATCC 30010 / Neff) TaxID=1257118 RepID=L8GUC3_ACACF|nr:uncharacterized protein ACA1_010620 [Acanthamoeba castellanii str. Neff]ELR16223.1 hypothetical protein ACA1_010620 [Acanthamoeba castellanii str. Neff]
MAVCILYDMLVGKEICNVWEAMLSKLLLSEAHVYYKDICTDCHIKALFGKVDSAYNIQQPPNQTSQLQPLS